MCAALQQAGVPEHIRALSSPDVLAVEADIVARLVQRAEHPAIAADIVRDKISDTVGALDVAQREAVAMLAGTGALLVGEGAAGAGRRPRWRPRRRCSRRGVVGWWW